MSRIDIEWDDKVFAKHLNYIRNQLEKEVGSIIEKGGQFIVDVASKTAPKQYGFLRASIGKTNPSLISGSPKNAPQLKGVWRLEKDADGVSLEVGSGMKYARAMEYYQAAYSIAGYTTITEESDEGKISRHRIRMPTKERKRKLIKMREGQSPYLAPAFAKAKPLVIKDFKELIGKVLNAKG